MRCQQLKSHRRLLLQGLMLNFHETEKPSHILSPSPPQEISSNSVACCQKTALVIISFIFSLQSSMGDGYKGSVEEVSKPSESKCDWC